MSSIRRARAGGRSERRLSPSGAGAKTARAKMATGKNMYIYIYIISIIRKEFVQLLGAV